MLVEIGNVNHRHVSVLVLALLVLVAVGVSTINGNAKQRAMSQEEAHLDAELANASCIDSYGTYATTDQKRASVLEYQRNGTIVRVQHPYWYGSDDAEADVQSEAVYFVSGDTVRLVRRAPLDLPC